MIELIRKYIVPHILNDKKIYLTFIFLLFFTILYAYCDDNEFHGWVDTARFRTNIEKKYLSNLFYKFAKKGYGYLRLDQFLKMPIIVRENKFYFSDNNSEITDPANIGAKKILFSIYDKQNKNKITYKEFLDLPIEVDSIPGSDKTYKPITPYDTKENNTNAVNTIFDRLYFSAIIQSNLGLGDIFPASKRVRIIMLLQTCISYTIIVLPYGVLSFMG